MLGNKTHEGPVFPPNDTIESEIIGIEVTTTDGEIESEIQTNDGEITESIGTENGSDIDEVAGTAEPEGIGTPESMKSIAPKAKSNKKINFNMDISIPVQFYRGESLSFKGFRTIKQVVEFLNRGTLNLSVVVKNEDVAIFIKSKISAGKQDKIRVLKH